MPTILPGLRRQPVSVRVLISQAEWLEQEHRRRFGAGEDCDESTLLRAAIHVFMQLAEEKRTKALREVKVLEQTAPAAEP